MMQESEDGGQDGSAQEKCSHWVSLGRCKFGDEVSVVQKVERQIVWSILYCNDAMLDVVVQVLACGNPSQVG